MTKAEKAKAIETIRAKSIRDYLKSPKPEVQRFIEDLLQYVEEWKPTVGKHLYSSRGDEVRFYFFRDVGMPVRLYIDQGRIDADGQPKGAFASFKIYRIAQHFEGADLTRLRRCPIETCKKIFWAFPRHQAGCNKTHSNTIRQREKRLREKQEDEKWRKENGYL